MIIAIVGPTGVGKTKMSIELAKKYNAEIICWLNNVLQKAVSYCPPELYYKGVPLGGELSLFYPDEAHELEVPRECTPENLYSLVTEYMKNL